jgi:hypothetical protein
LQLVPAVQAVVEFSCPCLLKAYQPAALNAPFSHRRITSHRRAASFANRSHIIQPPEMQNMAGIY